MQPVARPRTISISRSVISPPARPVALPFLRLSCTRWTIGGSGYGPLPPILALLRVLVLGQRLVGAVVHSDQVGALQAVVSLRGPRQRPVNGAVPLLECLQGIEQALPGRVLDRTLKGLDQLLSRAKADRGEGVDRRLREVGILVHDRTEEVCLGIICKGEPSV